MQFQVPQFIDIEDKLFGPLTFTQFVYVVGGGGIIYLLWQLPFWNMIKIIIIIPVAALVAALAFKKINGKPFVYILQAGLKYYTSTRLYLWKKTEVNSDQVQKPQNKKIEYANITAPVISRSKLRELSWSLDVTTKDKI